MSDIRVPTISLPALTRAGALRVHSDHVGQVSAPNLVETHSIELNAPQLLRLDFGSLRRLEWDLLISSTPSLLSLDLPALEQIVEGELYLWRSGVTRVRLPRLTRVGTYLVISENDNLVTVELPALASTSALRVRGCDALTVLELPSLERVASERGEALVISANRRLHAVSAPRLVFVSSLEIEGNPALTTITAPELAHVERRFAFTGNASYPECLVPATFPRLDLGAERAEGTIIERNRLDCQCGVDADKEPIAECP